MKTNLKTFKRFLDYENFLKENSLELPNVSLLKLDNSAIYNETAPEQPIGNKVVALFDEDVEEYDGDAYNSKIDEDHCFIYSGIINIDGSIYHKWEKVTWNDRYGDLLSKKIFLLTDTRDLQNVSFENPYAPCGYLVNDSFEDEFYSSERKIVFATTEMPDFYDAIPDLKHHNAYSLNNNGEEYIDLGLPSGTLWAACNIGANSPEEFGHLYAWGETQAKSRFSYAIYKFRGTNGAYTKYNNNDGLTTLEIDDDAAFAMLGGDWHMPLLEHIIELMMFTKRSVCYLNNASCYKYTSLINGNSIIFPDGRRLWAADIRLSSNPVSYTKEGPGDASQRWDGLNVRGILY